jgi:hypothetical protein
VLRVTFNFKKKFAYLFPHNVLTFSIWHSQITDTISLNSINCWVLTIKQLQTYSIRGLERSLGFQEFEAHRILENGYMHVVRLSALLTGRLCPQNISLVLNISVRGWDETWAMCGLKDQVNEKFKLRNLESNPRLPLLAQCYYHMRHRVSPS